MNVQHLRCLIETINAGSISAAARRLGKSHSTLSTAIASLEDDLGLTLLDRTGHKPTLTEDCKRLLPDIVRAIEGCDHLRSLADSLIAGVERRVRIVCDSTAPFQPLASISAGVETDNVGTEFRFDITFGTAEQEVMEQRADLGLVTRTHTLHPETGSIPIAQYRWSYYCHRDYPLLEHVPNITNTRLNQHTNLILDEVQQAMPGIGQLGRNRVRVNSPLGLYFMLVNQHGFALMPNYFADLLPGSVLVKFTPIDLPTDLKLPCCLVWNPKANHGPIVQQLIAQARELYG